MQTEESETQAFHEIVVPFTGVMVLKADHSTQHDLERRALSLLLDMEKQAIEEGNCQVSIQTPVLPNP